ncbi:hypothetical protein LTR95_016287 [Oleoguttula sp. CCFEE 5521]
MPSSTEGDVACAASRRKAEAALSTLCRLCAGFTRAFERETINNSVPGFLETTPGFQSQSYSHQTSFARLEAASSACALCGLFREALLARDTEHSADQVREMQLALDDTETRSFEISGLHQFEDLTTSVRRFRGIAYTAVSSKTGFTIESAWLSMSADDQVPVCMNNRRLDMQWDSAYFRGHIDQCIASHTECDLDTKRTLPTRLLDLGDLSSDAPIRLIEDVGDHSDYVALSYCWGLSRPYCTTNAILKDHLNGIAFDALPRMYTDAIRATRSLGFTYLWIDALCIVQDDPQDWLHESARMGAIYEGAVLTINAPSASSVDEAMLRSRNEAPSCVIPVAWEDGEPRSTATVALTDQRHQSLVIEGPDCPLNNRAWVFQEHLLATRTLTFGTVHNYLSCRRHTIFETAAAPVPSHLVSSPTRQPEPEPQMKNGILSELQTGADAHTLWYLFLVHYTARYLTYGNDKLPAILGLASRFSKHLPEDRFVAGLWFNDLVNGLAWLRFDQYRDNYHRVHSLHPRTVTLPSWSWAACDRHIRHIDVCGTPEVSHDLIDVVGLENTDLQSTGNIRQPLMPLRLHGTVIPCSEERVRRYETHHFTLIKPVIATYYSEYSIGGPNYFLVLPEPYECEAHWVHDTDEEQQPRSTDELGVLSILPLSLAVKPPPIYSSAPTVSPRDHPCLRALVVRPSKVRTGAFERVGFAACLFKFPRSRWTRQPSQRTAIDLV